MHESKTIVITGASDGIGAAAARRLHRDGHRVVVVGRSPEKTRAVAAPLQADWYTSDFADLASVRGLAAELLGAYPRIDVLANNAGGVFGQPERTVDGFERTIQIDHLAPFLLTSLLLERLAESRATVVQTSSVAARLYGRIDTADLDNERRFSATKAYGDAKLANILFTRELHRRFHGAGIDSAAFHPGFVGSGFAGGTTSRAMRLVYGNPLVKPFLRSADQGADQLVWLAETEEGAGWSSGGFYEHRRPVRRLNPQVSDARLAARLWDVTADLVGVDRAAAPAAAPTPPAA